MQVGVQPRGWRSAYEASMVVTGKEEDEGESLGLGKGL